ncbi:MAG: hypothetical protein OEY56_12860, partial [Cyclobacteriaceae bacterium]|nr:hypothetical protein [Cyclobacteriaceae bacterium]
MKQFTFLLLSVLMASAAYGQKPKLGKAEVLLKNGSLAEARDIVDMAVDYEKTKDNPKTYYLRGLVYAALDTTGSDLVDNPFEIAIASFAKSDELNDSDKELFLIGSNGFPVTKGQHIQEYYSYYFEKAAASFGDERYDDATNEFVLAQQIMPNDTVAFVYAGYAANSAENYPVAKANFEKAIEMGAADKDMYNLLVYIIGTKEEDKEGALKMINRARKIYPSDSDLARNEIALLIQMERVEEAQASLMSQIENEPDDPNLYFTLGILYQELADNSEGANVKA